MRDMGRSDDPRVQAQLDRLSCLSIQRDSLGLDAIAALMDRLGNPHRRLPPVFHVAGTNGKGSTCAFLRAILEADNKRVHVTTSPHLVRYNERFRIAGKLIEDGRLAELLEEVFDAAEGLDCSFFEITIAAAFVEFARVPADACVVEVGLGGRLDATNVLEPNALAACGIAALGIDHERFLLAPEKNVPAVPMARIAFEKAGIAKKGVPIITMTPDYPAEAQRQIRICVAENGAILSELTHDDLFEFTPDELSLRGEHQSRNAALAVGMLRQQRLVTVSEQAVRTGLGQASWPARMQRLSPGPLIGTREVWLDGGHNLSAGEAIAAEFEGFPLHIIIGMLEAKDPASITGPLGTSVETITTVPVQGYDCHSASAFGVNARDAATLNEALQGVPDDGLPILIAGSLYLAGEVLRANDEIPD